MPAKINHNFVNNIATDPDAESAGEVTPTIWNTDTHKIIDKDGNIVSLDSIIAPLGYVNVKTYGALGDGETDDTASFISALVVSNGNIFVPKGTFMVNLNIAMGNFNIKGAGKFITVLKSYNPSTSTIKVNGASTYIDGWTISDLSVNGNTGVGLELFGTSPDTVSHGECRNLEIENSSKGIWTHGFNMDIYKNMFQNIRIINCTNGIYRDTNGAYDSFLNIEIVNIPNGGYAIYEQSISALYMGVSIDGCVYNSGDYNRFMGVTIETINATTPPDQIAFRNAGNFIIVDIALVEVSSTKCPTGFYTNNPGTIIQSLVARGTNVPTYLMTLDTASAGVVLYAYGGTYTASQYMAILGSSNSWEIMESPFFVGLKPKVAYKTAAPTTGTWSVGDICNNVTPTAGGYRGWICITAGTPGTWKGYGLIQS